MSHNIDYTTYEENCDRKKVQRSWDEYVSRVDWQEGASGLPCPIRWVEGAGIFNSYNEAKEYLEKHDRVYDCFAVRFKEVDREVERKDKKLKELQEKYDKAHKIAFDLDYAYHFYGVKSETIGCKNCGSKIASKYMRDRNTCPVCHADMRPQTTLDRIKSANERAKEYSKQVQARMDELTKKASKVMWLVKTEYHT